MNVSALERVFIKTFHLASLLIARTCDVDF
jgi:hypothetical protein